LRVRESRLDVGKHVFNEREIARQVKSPHSVFSATGAHSCQPWGIAPGISSHRKRNAESAIQVSDRLG